MEKDKTEIEIAIECIQRQLVNCRGTGPTAETYIDALTDALGSLIVARNLEMSEE